MPYVKHMIQAGDYMIVDKHFSPRYGTRGIPRGENTNTTPPDMAVINERRAVEKLWHLLLHNFNLGDHHLTLTYQRDKRLPPEEARKELERFFRRARKIYRAQGKELVYIAVTEWEGKAIHHHIICNQIDVALLVPAWPRGMIRTTYLYDDQEQGKRFRALAQYLIKETRGHFHRGGEHGSRRWNQSRSIKQPRETTVVIPAGEWTKQPRPTKGWALAKGSLVEGYCERSQMPYQTYCLVRQNR